MDYKEALDYIHNTNKFGVVLGLDNITKLLDLLGNPQKDMKFIHVAGTNGKGSTSSYIATILKQANYEVGFFTSPFLEVFNERIRINNENIPDDDLAEVTAVTKIAVDKMIEEGFSHPTEFEVVTAIALEYYKRKQVDFVILEVGLGGRYDSTNVIEKSLISVLVPIAMDHIDVLGDTLEKIAYEKAGIIKENGLVVTYPQEEEARKVVEEVAKEKNAQLVTVPTENLNIKEMNELGSKFDFKYKDFDFKDLQIRLIGKHQAYNASTALTALLTLKEKGEINLTEEDIRVGLEATRWMGRLELLNTNPRFIIDGAHNMQGIEALKKTIGEVFEYDRLILGLGILADKDVENMIAEMAPVGDEIIVTTPNIFRAMEAEELGERISKYNKNYTVEPNIEKAIDLALSKAGPKDIVLFSGSLYLIGDVRRYAKNK